MKKQINYSTSTSTSKQAGYLVKSFNSEDKSIVSSAIGLEKAEVSAEDLVALKAKLGIPWEKLKKIGRYFLSLVFYKKFQILQLKKNNRAVKHSESYKYI